MQNGQEEMYEVLYNFCSYFLSSICFRKFWNFGFEFCTTITYKKPPSLKIVKKNLHEFLENSVKKNLTYIAAI